MDTENVCGVSRVKTSRVFPKDAITLNYKESTS